MSYIEPSKEVKELQVLHQDLYEVKRLQASLSQLPDGNLKASLEERVAAYLQTGQTITDFQVKFKNANKANAALESRISQMTQEIAELVEGRNLDPAPKLGFGLKSLFFSFLFGYVLACIYLINFGEWLTPN